MLFLNTNNRLANGYARNLKCVCFYTANARSIFKYTLKGLWLRSLQLKQFLWLRLEFALDGESPIPSGFQKKPHKNQNQLDPGNTFPSSKIRPLT